jgi:glycosyltransferase involved in cell wall biosynthesis
MTRRTVAAVIPTKNVQKIIRGTLESLRWCDEVILVDMHSTDATREIAESYPNVRYFAREGYIYANFNFGMEQAKSDWIIRVDSDERLSPELQREIVALLDGATQPRADVYLAPYLSYFIGHACQYAEKQGLREILFKKGMLAYTARSEHESLAEMPGKQPVRAALLAPYYHFSCPSIKKYLDKVNYYSERDMERTTPEELEVMSPARVVYLFNKWFLTKYVKQKGYKDGYHGFALSFLDSFYYALNWIKAWEKKTNSKAIHDALREDYDSLLAKTEIKRA